METIEQNEVPRKQRNIILKKIGFLGFCCLTPVIVPVSFLFTVFWSITVPNCYLVSLPWYNHFKNFEMKNGIADFVTRFGISLWESLAEIIILAISIPFEILLLGRWLKSVVIGFKKVTAYIISDENEILVSNKLEWPKPIEIIKPGDAHLHVNVNYGIRAGIAVVLKFRIKKFRAKKSLQLYVDAGCKIKSGFIAVLGYLFSIFKFDVQNRPKKVVDKLKKQLTNCQMEKEKREMISIILKNKLENLSKDSPLLEAKWKHWNKCV